MNPSPHTRLTDQDLLRHFYEDHDNVWLGSLLERYTMLLYGVCMKYLKNPEEAKDAVQQIFLKAITELHKYEVNYFGSWLYMIAKNHCLMSLRNHKHKVPVDLVSDLPLINEEPDPLLSETLLSELDEALQHLNGAQKICIRKFYLERKSYQAVAAETGYTLLQVKSYIQNGKRNLRLLLQNKTDYFDK